MNLLLWERQILHFNYGLLENLQNLLQQSDEFQEGTGGNLTNLKSRHFFIMTFVSKLSQKGELGGPGWFVCLFSSG